MVDSFSNRYPDIDREDIQRLIEIYQSFDTKDFEDAPPGDFFTEGSISQKLYHLLWLEKSKKNREQQKLEAERIKAEALGKELAELRDTLNISEYTPYSLSEDTDATYGKFHSLSEHDRKAYYYWRTSLRNGHVIETPRIFIRTYLYTITNFVEFDSVDQCISEMKKLLSLYEGQNLIIHDINYYLDRFITFYGDEEDVGRYISEGVAGGYVFNPYLPENVPEESLLNGDFSNAIDILSVGGHKIKASQVYKNPIIKDTIDKEFPMVLERMIRYFAGKGVDLMRILGGIFRMYTIKLEDQYHQYVHPVKDRIYEKTVYSDYGNIMLQVTKDSVSVRLFRAHALRSQLRKLILRMYDNNLRDRYGIKRKLKIDYSTIRFEGGVPEDKEDVQKVYDAIISPDFLDVFP